MFLFLWGPTWVQILAAPLAAALAAPLAARLAAPRHPRLVLYEPRVLDPPPRDKRDKRDPPPRAPPPKLQVPRPPVPLPVPPPFTAVKVDKSNLQPGDHIFRFRLGGFYSHHGIYVGDGQVIHFHTPRSTQLIALAAEVNSIPSDMEDSESDRRSCKICSGFSGGSGSKHAIVKCCIDCFGDTIYLYEYGVSWPQFWLKKPGVCCPFKSKPLKDVVNTAYDKKKFGFGAYDLITNNCEHFATFCSTGKKFSGQTFIMYPALAKLPANELENIAAGNCTNKMLLEAAN